ncbi:hypothetical protein [Gordonia sp. KTR9]|uniref:hypothetical protein n=1 Tax=Gordonia sp. KTR9 TaxID=337191 RepID=UPI0003160FD5|nr:hypothetical protein [Gordonia sp. KTR9]
MRRATDTGHLTIIEEADMAGIVEGGLAGAIGGAVEAIIGGLGDAGSIGGGSLDGSDSGT